MSSKKKTTAKKKAPPVAAATACSPRRFAVDFWDVPGNTFIPVPRPFMRNGYTLVDAYTNVTPESVWGRAKIDHTKMMTSAEYHAMRQNFDYFKPGIPNPFLENASDQAPRTQSHE